MMVFSAFSRTSNKLRFVGVVFLVAFVSGFTAGQEKSSTQSQKKLLQKKLLQKKLLRRKLLQKSCSKKAAAKKSKQEKSDTDKRLDLIESKLDKLADSVSKLSESKAPQKKQDVTSKPAAPAKTAPKKAPADNQEKAKASPFTVSKATLQPESLKLMPFRSIGPANMAGRIADVEIHASDPSLWWIATAGGGILKTTNRGTTVEHQFDKQTTVSIGAIASDPQDKNILWVGTGEINPRNSGFLRRWSLQID